MDEVKITYVPEEKLFCPSCGMPLQRIPPLNLQLAYDKASSHISVLREALIGLVGSSTKAELEQMAFLIRRKTPANKLPEVLPSLDAIYALLATMEGL